MPKNLLKSILPLLISVLLIIVVGRYGIGKLSSVRSEISQAQADKATLTEKLSTLRSLGATVQSESQVATIVLPDKNPALLVLSQLKSLAAQSIVSLVKVKIGSGSSEGAVSSVGVTFEVVGPREGVFAFLVNLEKIAPIVLGDKVKINEGGGETRAAITIKSYWAAFPTKLPGITQPVSTLTTAEESLLSKVSSLVPPQLTNIPASEGAGKPDPFAQ